MNTFSHLILSASLIAPLALFSGCAGDEQPPTCGGPTDLPVHIYVYCDQDSFAPAEELGALALVVEGRVHDGPWVECARLHPEEAPPSQHLCDDSTTEAPRDVMFTCGDNLVTEVRAHQGLREAQAFTYYNKLSCINSNDVALALTETAR